MTKNTFLCVFVSLLVSYGTAKMRGKVYGIPRQSEASRKRQQAIYEQQHKDKLDARKVYPIISIWQSDFRRDNPNICEFCRNLNATWFHGIHNSGQAMNLLKEDLEKMKEMYLQQVYTPNNFPITWRDINTWRDVNGNSLYLHDFTEDDIKNFYFDRCPREPVTIGDVLSFIGTITTTFVTIIVPTVMFAALCA